MDAYDTLAEAILMGDQGDNESLEIERGRIWPDKAEELVRDIWHETQRILRENEESTQGVYSIIHDKHVLFSGNLKFRVADLPKWEPHTN